MKEKITAGLIDFGMLITLFASNVTAQGDFDLRLRQQFQSLLDTKREQYNLTGISAAIVHPILGTWKGTAGWSQETQQTLTPDMLLGIGSVTKTYMTALTLQLVDEGILTLDDSLHQWLPAYPNIDGAITIRQLLAHQSGVHDFTEHPGFSRELFADLERIWQPEETLLTLLNSPYFKAGTGFRYSNTNFLLLGMILEKAGGQSISSILKTRIFEPLNLQNSYLAIEDQLPRNVAHGWTDIDLDGTLEDFTLLPREAYYSLIWTSGAIFATAEDAARFMKAVFEGELFSRELLDEMTAPNSERDLYYTLGAYTRPSGNYAYWGHDGLTIEYRSRVMVESTTKTSFAIIVNQRVSSLSLIGLMSEFMRMIDATVDVRTANTEIPDHSSLAENWPNPFNPETSISYELSGNSNVSLTVFNLLGQRIRTLIDGYQFAGNHSLIWNGKDDSGIPAPSGLYIYTLQADDFVASKRMTLIK
jgi:CubicO group peptidase (beta-lactamase class C family)